MYIERYKTSISHSTIKDYSVPVTIEYLSDGIKVGIIDIYLDTDVLFDEDVFKAGTAFTNYNLPFEAIFEKSEDEIYSDLKSEISAVKFLNHMQNFVDSRKAI